MASWRRRCTQLARISGCRHRRYSTAPADPLAAIRDLRTQSTPSTLDSLPPALAAQRQQLQSNVWAQQIVSGARVSTVSGASTTRELLIRVKPKQRPQPSSGSLMSVDELETYSNAIGKSRYLPLSARGVLEFTSDPALRRLLKDVGYIRPDIVEHCARVLRLRTLNTMHRAHTQLFSHMAGLSPTMKAESAGASSSRLQLIRREVSDRIVRQDAQWPGASIDTSLPPPETRSVQDGSGDGADMSWPLLDLILPAGGLQCILELPVPADQGTELSMSSEAHARSVWAALPSTTPFESDVLDYSHNWKAFLMPGLPELHCQQPTLSTQALEHIYHLLPPLTPPSMRIPDTARGKGSKRRHKQQIKVLGQQMSPGAAEAAASPVLRSLARIRYSYSVSHPGIGFQASSDGQLSKLVPVYHMEALFGRRLCATVVPWLLGRPVSLDCADEFTAERQYIGVVSLPCTADLATQLHRVSVYATAI
ncbi:hypothetical protein H4S01_001936 [Coemansia sp. RSA 2610]|nr:hypothetical protein H4S01_001936 [Coemansia sp. RSA 2610]